MHTYRGIVRYETNNSGRLGQYVNVAIHASFFPGQFTVTVEDERAESVHRLENRRFNYQARDSPVDLLARDKWKSHWFDRFTGPIYLDCPRLPGVPRELKATVICSWDPAFVVVEFKWEDTFYQFSCRPPRGVNSWNRSRYPLPRIHEDSTPSHEPASGSADVPPVIHVSPPTDESDAPPIGLSSSPFGGSDSERTNHRLLDFYVHGV